MQLLDVDFICEGKLQFVQFFMAALLHRYHDTVGKLQPLIDGLG